MIRRTIISRVPIALIRQDKKKCGWISKAVFLQCILVYIGSATILNCTWTLENTTWDFDKLARIMYLYDSHACGYKLTVAKTIANLQFSNDTRGLNVVSIQWKPAMVTVSTRLSAKTRIYIEISVVIHVIWMIITIFFQFTIRHTNKIRYAKVSLALFFYATVCVIVFDISMGIVYVAHIKQSLTKGMVLRYSGWSVELKLITYDDFAGWLPIIASICWMRGIFILCLNIYMCKVVHSIRRKIQKKELGKRVRYIGNPPIPEPKSEDLADKNVLYFRTGENVPYVKKDLIHRVLF